MPGERVEVTGSTQTTGQRPVELQIRRKGAAWRLVDVAVTSRSGGYSFTYRAPRKPGAYQVRVHAPAGRFGGDALAALDTRALPQDVTRDRVTVARNRDALVDGSFEFLADFTQVRRGRPVWLQTRDTGATRWATVARATQSRKGLVRFVDPAGSVEGERTYRIVAPPRHGAPDTTSGALEAAVTHWADIADGTGRYPSPSCGTTATHHLYCSAHAYERDASVPMFGNIRYDRHDFVSVEAPSLNTSCGVTPTGAAWCWGTDDFGKLGDGGGDEDSAAPVKVVGGDWSTVSPGYEETCGIKTDTTLWCWGNLRDETGPDVETFSPQQVGDETGYTDVETGRYLACWVRDGSIGCNGREASHAAPLTDADYDDWTDISTGSHSVCGLRDGGVLLCGGDPYSTPGGVDIGGTDRFIALDMTNGSDLCAVREDHTLWCSTHDLLGDTPQGAFRQIGDRDDWADVEADGWRGCATTVDGVVRCWYHGDDDGKYWMRTLGIGR